MAYVMICFYFIWYCTLFYTSKYLEFLPKWDLETIQEIDIVVEQFSLVSPAPEILVRKQN